MELFLFAVSVLLLTLLSTDATNFEDFALLQKDLRPCYIAQKVPCLIGEKLFYPAINTPLQYGPYGLVQLAISPGDENYYVIKFTRMRKQKNNPHAVDELSVTNRLGEILPNNSIQVKYKEYSESNGRYQFAMVMPFYAYGDLSGVEHLADGDYFSLIGHKDEQVIKFMDEMGLVLRTMWSLGYVDRDFRLSNALITGNLSHPNSTTYVKIDYGAAIKRKHAVAELLTDNGRKYGFCHFGYNVKFCLRFHFADGVII